MQPSVRPGGGEERADGFLGNSQVCRISLLAATRADAAVWGDGPGVGVGVSGALSENDAFEVRYGKVASGESHPSAKLAVALLRALREADLDRAEAEETAQRRRQTQRAAGRVLKSKSLIRDNLLKSVEEVQVFQNSSEREETASTSSAHTQAEASLSRDGISGRRVLHDSSPNEEAACVLPSSQNASSFCYVPSRGCYTTAPIYAPLLDCLIAETQARQASLNKRSTQPSRAAHSYKNFLSLEREAEAFVASCLIRRQLELRKSQQPNQEASHVIPTASQAMEAAPKWLAEVSRHLLPYVAQVTSRAFFDPVYRQQLVQQQQQQQL